MAMNLTKIEMVLFKLKRNEIVSFRMSEKGILEMKVEKYIEDSLMKFKNISGFSKAEVENAMVRIIPARLVKVVNGMRIRNKEEDVLDV